MAATSHTLRARCQASTIIPSQRTEPLPPIPPPITSKKRKRADIEAENTILKAWQFLKCVG
ncbi:hypothetical protein PILCRDRAFT_814164 [Piloderma croceum F 1598]|uniref:Uncharacterized protein n=1 Tax=Piloderma croceum (strain F 1598) TaxID=765440 RepID=A0A0C3FV20_PILCF|nr:hypothetical protein PILCRDRAFT_814164 [Piloderma croceum F 1598]